ncbi:Alpha-ketoglutarate-dependent repair dioxygenase AlkB [uncultured virus]|nr:Alpha-ketoglutarate-dependent repair dioxygenase AlkB [uncultured virus]
MIKNNNELFKQKYRKYKEKYNLLKRKETRQNYPDIIYLPKWIQSLQETDINISEILENISWYRVTYFKPLFKKILTTPRYTSVYGSDEDVNSAQKRKYPIDPIPDFLEPLLKQVENESKSHFNMIMCNLYLTHENTINWHSDDEKFLGNNPTIASLSLGGERKFLLREKKDHKNKYSFNLQNGDLLIMKGNTQHDWEHAIPKTKNSKPRINLTFRYVKDYRGTNNYYKYNRYGDLEYSKAKAYKFNKDKQNLVIE